MNKKTAKSEESMALAGRCINRIEKRDDGKWYYGTVITPHGVVVVQSEPPRDEKSGNFTRLDFSHKDKLHIRTYQRFYSPTSTVTLARRFAVEISKL